MTLRTHDELVRDTAELDVGGCDGLDFWIDKCAGVAQLPFTASARKVLVPRGLEYRDFVIWNNEACGVRNWKRSCELVKSTTDTVLVLPKLAQRQARFALPVKTIWKFIA